MPNETHAPRINDTQRRPTRRNGTQRRPQAPTSPHKPPQAPTSTNDAQRRPTTPTSPSQLSVRACARVRAWVRVRAWARVRAWVRVRAWARVRAWVRVRAWARSRARARYTALAGPQLHSQPDPKYNLGRDICPQFTIPSWRVPFFFSNYNTGQFSPAFPIVCRFNRLFLIFIRPSHFFPIVFIPIPAFHEFSALAAGFREIINQYHENSPIM